ncbi:hypothetical protein D3C57_142035 [Streptomyces rapamycinicus NRRL 5491]|uniref:Secreted protein n=1 Tax=Streptomyces rapamycinicus (strain ATCC 29253 / DSM 41530 / NRRL 5491 / AYB-994) TaxID=1343740 RepID=A0A3L8R8E3_STRRN|nr:hypothetical protein D3C57_142035 [Streptomyces rapamycinicus NRRL 5491]
MRQGNTLRKLKIASLAASALLLGSGMTAATAGSAEASDTPMSAARACTASAPRFTSSPGTSSSDPAFWPARGTYATTTSRCKDINLKLDGSRSVRTCFKTTGCNSWRTLRAGSWGVAATDVLDGTQFYLQFAGTSRATGLIDY